MHSSGKPGEATLLGQEVFLEMIKCKTSWTNVNNDKTSTVMSHLEYLMTQQQRSPMTHE